MNIWICYCCVDFKRRHTHTNKRDTQEKKWRVSFIFDDDTYKDNSCGLKKWKRKKRKREREIEKKERKDRATVISINRI